MLTNEIIDSLPQTQFDGQVVVIETEKAAEEAARQMMREPVLGFDTETRPAFRRGVTYKTALLQLASHDTAWLIRLNMIGLPRAIVNVLENPSIVKTGVAIRDDIRGLQRWHKFTPGNFVELQTLAHDHGLEEASLKKLAARVLGIRISKRQRLSNWEAGVLSIGQQLYAATDAWVGIESYENLVSGVTMHPRLQELINNANSDQL
ncbi:MAG: 3'-5' exonuclease domain-containing protein 2 [Bacteroidales bacterium]|nr:3'-5' exonuclease domain-containing protein 2 [Bacteroidales bacterium]